MHTLTARKAVLSDLPAIVNLLIEDELGQTREKVGDVIDQRYINAFQRIDTDPNQYLMVVVSAEQQIIATCHLTIMPSLTFIGSNRMQIEAVRVSSRDRGQKIGEWMMSAALKWAKANHVSMIQLTTNKKRPRAKQFYERLGFIATHEGMKLFLDEK
ncbi:MAG: GNAT family N-acetyltransferase [Legionellaceae bacterium]|nr:GNAT family N-acetyltransferase [Legionellaceae bacterium]